MIDSILVFVAKHASSLPERLVRGLFLLAADVLWLLGLGGERQLERNLVHVLHARDGAIPSRREVRHTARLAMRSYFTYFSEAMTLEARDTLTLDARVRGTGAYLADIQADARRGSVPAALGHQGNWDYAGFWSHLHLLPVTTVAERLSNEQLLEEFISIRKRAGISIFTTKTPGLTDRLKHVMTGEEHRLVPLLADRDLSHHGEFVEAFDSMIRVARGPATLSYDLMTPLYVVNVYRERLHGERRRAAKTPYGYVIDISGKIDPHTYEGMNREDALRAISQEWVRQWSAGVMAHPQDWHMLQPVFLEDMDASRMSNVPADVARRIASLHAHDHNRGQSADGEGVKSR